MSPSRVCLLGLLREVGVLRQSPSKPRISEPSPSLFSSPPSDILVMSGASLLLRGWVPFGRVGRRRGQRLPYGNGGRNHGPIEECPRRMRLLPGLPQGSRPSRGTWASYDRQGCLGQWGAAGLAKLFAEGVRQEISGTTVQPAVLPGAGLPGGTAALASSETATEVPIPARGTPATRRSGTPATQTAGSGGPEASGRRARRRGRIWKLRRVVTQQTTSRDFLRASRLL